MVVDASDTAFAFKTKCYYVILTNYVIGTQTTRIILIRTDFLSMN